MRKHARKLRTPHAQLIFAGVGMLVGGWLIAVWVLGLVMIVLAGLFAVDALLRDVKVDDEDLSSHHALLRRYERSR